MTSFRTPTEAEMLTVACPACKAAEGIACSDRPANGLHWRVYWDAGWLQDGDARSGHPSAHIKRSHAWTGEQMWRHAEANRLADLADIAFSHREGYDEFEDEHGNEHGNDDEGPVAVHRKGDEPDPVRDEDNEPEVVA